jgi:hypothetical protein
VDDDEAGAIIGASDDEEAGAIGAASDEDDAGAIGAASEEEEATGAAEDDDDTTAELDAGVTGAVVGVPRLKIQIRPMITITATMMIIQVLRFMGLTLCWRKVDREE